MLIRTFTDRSAPDALAQVRSELGSDACILEVRRGPESVEVLAAAERPGCTGPAVAPGLSAPLVAPAVRLRDRLSAQGFSPVVAERIAASAQANLESTELLDPDRALRYARELVAALVPIHSEPAHRSVRLLALVGSNGVGKTTTLLKIAAHEKLHHDRSVVLASADDRRLGGMEQVLGFARMIEVPFVEIGDRRDLDRARHLAGDDGLVLLDTPGVPRGDDALLAELGTLLAGVARSEIELLLAADHDVETLTGTVSRFRPLRPGSIGATRLDEAVRPGCLASALARSSLPLRHLGLGPNVPDDLRRAGACAFAGWAVPENPAAGAPFAGETA